MDSNFIKPWSSLSSFAAFYCQKMPVCNGQMSHAPSSELKPGLNTHFLRAKRSACTKKVCVCVSEHCACAGVNSYPHTWVRPGVCNLIHNRVNLLTFTDPQSLVYSNRHKSFQECFAEMCSFSFVAPFQSLQEK